MQCDKVCQGLATGRWFSPGTLVFPTNKIDPHDITELLLKVALNTITLTLPPILLNDIQPQTIIPLESCIFSKYILIIKVSYTKLNVYFVIIYLIYDIYDVYLQ